MGPGHPFTDCRISSVVRGVTILRTSTGSSIVTSFTVNDSADDAGFAAKQLAIIAVFIRLRREYCPAVEPVRETSFPLRVSMRLRDKCLSGRYRLAPFRLWGFARAVKPKGLGRADHQKPHPPHHGQTGPKSYMKGQILLD
jgi:hypothetical protein